MAKMKRPRLLFTVAVVVMSLAAASEAAPRRKSSRKLSSGNGLGGGGGGGGGGVTQGDGAAAEDLIPIPDHYLLPEDQAAAANNDNDDDDFEDYEYESGEEGEDDRDGKKREKTSSSRLSSRTLLFGVISKLNRRCARTRTFLSVKRVFFSGKQVFLRDEPLPSLTLVLGTLLFSKRGIFGATLKGGRECVWCGCLSRGQARGEFLVCWHATKVCGLRVICGPLPPSFSPP